MSETKKDWIAWVDKGKGGMPGSDYSDMIAGVRLVRPGRFELYVRAAWGSNQGYLEEHRRIEREFRAGSLDDLMRIGITEIRQDAEFLADDAAKLVAAIREACFEAEDKVQEHSAD